MFVRYVYGNYFEKCGGVTRIAIYKEDISKYKYKQDEAKKE